MKRPSRFQLSLLELLLDLSEEGHRLFALMTPGEAAAAKEKMEAIEKLWEREGVFDSRAKEVE